MKIYSNSFKNKEFMNEKYSAYGQNIFPHVGWSDLPEGTKSLALLVHDPDAPIASGFWHLQAVNISPKLNEIPENGLSKEIAFLKNHDGDAEGYFGPMPPAGHGVHKYVFSLYALPFEDLKELMSKNGLELTVESSRAYTAFFIEMNKLESVSLTGLFEKK